MVYIQGVWIFVHVDDLSGAGWSALCKGSSGKHQILSNGRAVKHPEPRQVLYRIQLHRIIALRTARRHPVDRQI